MGKQRGIWKDADVIHFHDYTPLIEWYLPFFTPNRRTYITFHGYEGYPVPYLSIMLRRLADKLTKGSICAGGFIPHYYGTPCSRITYGAISDPLTSPTTEKEGAIFVGGLREDVGIIGYLSTLAILQEKHGKKLTLTVIGDGPLKERVFSIAREKDIVLEFLGQRHDPSPFLARSKVALSDSYLVILEAMASRVPVFSYYDNPLKKDYLLCFPGREEILGIRDDPEELALDLATFLNDPGLYEERVERGSLFAREQTWAKVADMYRELYDE
jgi:glycosyltransferase involved in cell wall biosynthesis